jgi:hypothetical protein
MFILYGIYEDYKTAVAKFSSWDKAANYADSCKLDSGKFRRDSLLGSCYNYQIREEKKGLPINPDPINYPPSVEYLAVIAPNTRYNHGGNKKSAEKDVEQTKKMGGWPDAHVEERFV